MKNRTIFAYIFCALMICECLLMTTPNPFCGKNTLFIVMSENGYISVNNSIKMNYVLEQLLSNNSNLFNDEDKDIFYLYTKKNQNKHQVLVTDDNETLERSNFDMKKPTVVLYHGWRGTPFTSKIKIIMDVCIEYLDYNIITVDWSKYAKHIFYPLAVKYIQHVARKCRNFLRFLIRRGVDPKSLHLIGFSLGAPVAAYTAKFMDKKHKIGRLTGLDPVYALICDDLWSKVLVQSTFRVSMASFVEVMHTTTLLGIRLPVGHVDFYPDGGKKQKCCGFWEDITRACSHYKACEYYRDSIKKEDMYRGKKCTDFEDMQKGKCQGYEEIIGFHTPLSARGIFYLDIKCQTTQMRRTNRSVSFINRKSITPLMTVLFLFYFFKCLF